MVEKRVALESSHHLVVLEEFSNNLISPWKTCPLLDGRAVATCLAVRDTQPMAKRSIAMTIR